MIKVKLNNFKLELSARKAGSKLVFWATASVFMASYIFLTLQTVSSGSKFAALEIEEGALIKRNKELSSLIMQSTSLIQLGQKTEELGFVKPEKTFYIGENKTVAELR